ncbi:Helix-turn-helix [Edwardsiella tarda]|nr:Helix-turn-helix [Edwardsiella tarda]
MNTVESNRTFHNNQIVRFSERLKKAMGNTSKSELARRSGLSEAAVRKYLKGDSYPTIDSAAKVADACGVSLNWLLTGQDGSSDEPEELPQVVKKCDKSEDPIVVFISLLSFVGSNERKALATLACEIGIKGILDKLQQAQHQPKSAEEVIRALNIRESSKDAICMVLAGDESTDREILRRIESRNRARAQGDNTADTPREDEALGKKQA